MNDTPNIERIVVSTVTALPSFHPESGPSFKAFPVHVFLIHHGDGPIVVDTGIGVGNSTIDNWYKPETVDLRTELERRNVDPDSPRLTIVNTHLHFDHCGQNNAFPNARIVVQQAEAAMAMSPNYTIEAWAVLPKKRTTLVDGDHMLTDGIELIHTPGHTPGHQSVVVRSKTGTTIIAGQCLFKADEWNSATPNEANLHDEDHRKLAAESLARLRSLRPSAVLLSHDCAVNLHGK